MCPKLLLIIGALTLSNVVLIIGNGNHRKQTYPDLECWNGYVPGELERINYECKMDPKQFKEKHHWSVPCHRACVIYQMARMQHLKNDSIASRAERKYPSYLFKFFGLDRHGKGPYNKTTTKEKKTTIKTLSDKLVNCLKNSHKPYNKGIPCTQWQPLYDCFNSAVSCIQGRPDSNTDFDMDFETSKDEMDYMNSNDDEVTFAPSSSNSSAPSSPSKS